MSALSDEQLRRYARQILLPEVGGRGQRALLAAQAHVGLGELAAAQVAVAYLAGAGVGSLVLYGGARMVTAADVGFLLELGDIGAPLWAALARRVAERTPNVKVLAADPGEAAPPALVAPAFEGGSVPAPWPEGGGGEAAALWRGAAAATAFIADVVAAARRAQRRELP